MLQQLFFKISMFIILFTYTFHQFLLIFLISIKIQSTLKQALLLYLPSGVRVSLCASRIAYTLCEKKSARGSLRHDLDTCDPGRKQIICIVLDMGMQVSFISQLVLLEVFNY